MARARGKGKVNKARLADTVGASGMRLNPLLRWRYHTKGAYYSVWYEGASASLLGTIKRVEASYSATHTDSKAVIVGLTTLHRALYVLQTIQQLGAR